MQRQMGLEKTLEWMEMTTGHRVGVSALSWAPAEHVPAVRAPAQGRKARTACTVSIIWRSCAHARQALSRARAELRTAKDPKRRFSRGRELGSAICGIRFDCNVESGCEEATHARRLTQTRRLTYTCMRTQTRAHAHDAHPTSFVISRSRARLPPLIIFLAHNYASLVHFP